MNFFTKNPYLNFFFMAGEGGGARESDFSSLIIQIYNTKKNVLGGLG